TPEHESLIREQREPAVAPALVADPHAGHLQRVALRGEQADLLLQTLALVTPGRVAEAMAHLVAHGLGQRPGQRRPERAGVLVAHVERFAVRVRDRVVEPRRQPVLAAVAAPGVPGARLAHPEAEALRGD